MAARQDRPWPVWMALTALVLLAHLALLVRTPPHWTAPRPAEPVRAWSTRTLPRAAGSALPPAALPLPDRAAPGPASAPPPRPSATVQKPATAPRTVSPQPAALPAQPVRADHPPLALPGPARWEYEVEIEVRGQRRQAEGTLLWQHDGSHYEARLELSDGFAPGPRQLASTGRIGPQGLAPVRYAETGRRAFTAHVDATASRVVFSANTPEATLQAGAQDRLSVLLQLAALLAGDPARYPAGRGITVQTISAREAEPWTFTVEGSESVHLPNGPATLLKLLREPRRPYDARIEVWLDPGHGHRPARLRTTLANGDWLDQRLK
jgi:hypothetical protein